MECRYNVLHRGRAKMVGKLFRQGDRHVFLHDESGSQHLRILDSPGGLDAILLDTLRGLIEVIGPIDIHHRRGGHAFSATLALITAKGARKVFDGRDRYFLPQEHWREIEDYGNGPWVYREETLDPGEIINWTPVKEPEPNKPKPRLQGGLFDLE